MADPRALEALVTCPVCLSRLTRPKILPCQHSLCLTCLEKLVQEGYYESEDGEKIPVLFVECPECRGEYEVPEEGVEQFPDALGKKQTLDAVPEAEECFHCGFERVTRECHHCHHQLCDACRKEHQKLTTNILDSLHAMVGTAKQHIENKENIQEDLPEKLETAIDETKNMEEKIDAAIAELNAVLYHRKDTLVKYAKGILFFQQYLLDKVSKKKKKKKEEEQEEEKEEDEAEEGTEEEVTEENEAGEETEVENIHELNEITEIRELQELQDSLAELQKNTNFVRAIGEGRIPDFEYDVSIANSFGKIACKRDDEGDESESEDELAIDEETESYEAYDDFRGINSPQTTRRRSVPSRNTSRPKTTRSISTVEAMEMVNILPSNVRYKAKQHSVRTILDREPGVTATRKLQPACAVYSNREKAMYVISNGAIFELDLQGGGSFLLKSPQAEALALTESSNLLIMEREQITRLFCIMLGYDQYSEPETIAQFTNAHKICCHGNEFAVLDIGRKYIAKFDEDGGSFLSFGASKLTRVDENSQMTVDRDGRLYVTTEGGMTKTPSQLVCRACNVYSRLLVTWQLPIQVFTWQGKFLREICITGTQKYDYAFGQNSVRCKNSSSPTWHKVRNEQSVPSDDEMERKVKKNAAGGMCVDSDGYITITRPQRDKIDVYSRTGSFHCSIANPAKKNEFREPSGVSLMPDGRMIVCDSGNNRILLL